jgi:hypothetical protein
MGGTTKIREGRIVMLGGTQPRLALSSKCTGVRGAFGLRSHSPASGGFLSRPTSTPGLPLVLC